MYIVDDPLLALLVRFVGVDAGGDPMDQEFLRRQIAAIQAYVEQFPEDERNARAIQWITEHAQHYRRQWQLLAACEGLAKQRCPDCPLVRRDSDAPCAIHDHWLDLLRRYAHHEIDSPEYVERTLELLARYKARLRVRSRGG